MGTLALALAPWALPAGIEAATFYVRQGGDDARDGRSPASAFATIRRGASKAGGGDTIVVGPGRYAEGDITPVGNGRPREPVRFVGDFDGSRTGDPPGPVVVDASGHQFGFRISARPWVIVNGFSVTNALEEGIAIKSRSDSSVVANCVVFSNRGRGIWVRDSKKVVLFNNLVYDNFWTGIDFGGDAEGSPGGAAINNTVYANRLDGIRIEGLSPSPRVLLVNNVIAQNRERGINLKERSASGFVAQWNLNIDGYGSVAKKAAFDSADAPLLVAPSGADQVLGGEGFADDDFRLRQLPAGQPEQSRAVDGSPIPARRLGLGRSTTATTASPDGGLADLGFHYGGKADFVSGLPGSLAGRLRALRRRAVQCERLGRRESGGITRCITDDRYMRRLRAQCGPFVQELCG